MPRLSRNSSGGYASKLSACLTVPLRKYGIPHMP